MHGVHDSYQESKLKEVFSWVKNSFLFYIYIEWQMFKFTVATFQEICKSNHYAVHLKLQCCMSICILIKLGKKIKWWGCGENGAPGYYWQECKLVQSLWKTIWWFLKKLKIGLPYNPQSHFWEYIQGNKNRMSKTYMYSHFQCSKYYSQ